MRFLWSIIGILIGIFLIVKTFALTQLFGKVGWAERYLSGGLGGTYLMYKLFGIILIILSAMHMFGILDVLLLPIARIFGGFVPQE